MTEENKVQLKSIYGIKAGMTRIFDQEGNHIPVTVIKLVPNFISQVKTKEKDGYEAYQVAYGEKREKLIPNPIKGHLAKAKLNKTLYKFAEVPSKEAVKVEDLGKQVSTYGFKPQTYVDVTGYSKGKGFQGVMVRHNFQGGPAAHGSHFHRRPGSIGNRATPGRVFRGKKMPGRMGNAKRTMQNLIVVDVNTKDGYMLIRGSVPGSKNGFVKITTALKK